MNQDASAELKHLLPSFRDPALAKQVLMDIRNAVHANRTYRIMEFCGGHTHTLFRYGIPDLLPDNIRLLHGPGCPVCVLPIQRVDQAISLAQQPDTILCSYGDAMKIPGTGQMSLLKAKAQGADIRMVLDACECIEIAKQSPDKKVIFMALGFETTTPPTAVLIEQALKASLSNVFIFCNHVLTPPAMLGILSQLDRSNPEIEGFIGPGHVSLVTGWQAFVPIAEEFKVPISVAGFEALDLLQGILMLIRQINAGTHKVENQYTRAVKPDGNPKAQALCERFFEIRKSFEWRGLGQLPDSAIRLKDAYEPLNAERLLASDLPAGKDNKACECPAVLMGRKTPFECKLFDKPCTPDNPLGSCMVSSEGACAAYYRYRRHTPPPNVKEGVA